MAVIGCVSQQTWWSRINSLSFLLLLLPSTFAPITLYREPTPRSFGFQGLGPGPFDFHKDELESVHRVLETGSSRSGSTITFRPFNAARLQMSFVNDQEAGD